MSNRRDVTCPTCGSESSILHGNKVMCPCGTTYGLTDRGESYVKTQRPARRGAGAFEINPDPYFFDSPQTGRTKVEGLSEARKAKMREIAHMFNYTSPEEKTVEYAIEERDGVFVVFSKAYPITKDGKGSAINFVAERDSKEAAEELVARLKNL